MDFIYEYAHWFVVGIGGLLGAVLVWLQDDFDVFQLDKKPTMKMTRSQREKK